MSKVGPEDRVSRSPELCAATALGIAVLALAGWLTGARYLAGQWGSHIPMAPSTVLGFLLLGGGLLSFARWPAERLARFVALAAASVVSLLALLVLAQFLTGVDLGVEPIPLRTIESLGATPVGRMSPLTAGLFLLESEALLLLFVGLRWRPAPAAAALLASSASAIGVVVLTGYAYGAPVLYGGTFIPVAMPTALSFVLVGLGQLKLAVPGVAALDAWRHPSLRGRLLRTFLPATLLLVVIEGWADIALGTSHAPNPALWHSLIALVASVLIVVITGSIARHAGDDIETAHAQIRSLSRFPDENPNPVLRFARDGTLLYANRSSRRLLEYWRCERPGQLLPEPERRWIAETLARSDSRDQEVTCDGIVYWLVLMPVPEMGYVNIYGRDVTARKRSEAALLEKEERLRTSRNLLQSIVDNTPALVYVFDKEERVLVANKALAELVGLAPSDIIGKRRHEFLPRETAERDEENDRSVIEADCSRQFEEAGTFRGEKATFLTVKFPLRDERGDISGIGGISTDMTGRKHAEEALRHSREQLRALAARLQAVREEERIGIARELHDELGQALTGMQIDLMWLDGHLRSAGPADLPALGDKIAALVPLTERLIETTQRISSTLRPGMLDDLGLVAAVEWLAADFAKRTGLACTTTLPSEDIALNTARDVALFRIVQEALTNVIRHAHATSVEVRLSVADGELLLDVQDNGRGTTPEQVTAHRSLGLLSMRERAAVLGGTVDIQSEPGRGTSVRVRMPSAISHST